MGRDHRRQGRSIRRRIPRTRRDDHSDIWIAVRQGYNLSRAGTFITCSVRRGHKRRGGAEGRPILRRNGNAPGALDVGDRTALRVPPDQADRASGLCDTTKNKIRRLRCVSNRALIPGRDKGRRLGRRAIHNDGTELRHYGGTSEAGPKLNRPGFVVTFGKGEAAAAKGGEGRSTVQGPCKDSIGFRRQRQLTILRNAIASAGARIQNQYRRNAERRGECLCY